MRYTELVECPQVSIKIFNSTKSTTPGITRHSSESSLENFSHVTKLFVLTLIKDIARDIVATITLTDSSSPASAGTVSITGAGDGKATITNGTVTVAPGETVRIWVSRSDGTNGRAECWVAPTDGTATADMDYYWGGTPCRIGWESGEGGDRCVMFGTSSDVKAVKHFTVKIADLSGDGSEAPVFGTRTVRVVIDPDAPAPVYEETALQSAAGSFMGILRERTGYGEEARTLSRLSVNVSQSAISATLTVAGTEINLQVVLGIYPYPQYTIAVQMADVTHLHDILQCQSVT